MKARIFPVICIALAAAQLHAADTGVATTAINSLGIDLLAKTNATGNTLLSPYSIQSALAMTYAGAAGKTREEMATVLHFPKDSAELSASFSALLKHLAQMQAESDESHGGKISSTPVTINMANRLYGQEGYDFRKSYLTTVAGGYGAPLEQLDFKNEADKAAKLINDWVAAQTHDRIQNLIPPGALTKETRLVLVNAIYLKASWMYAFRKEATRPAPFHVNGGDTRDVPMMNHQAHYNYAKKDGYTAIGIPYVNDDLQFLVLLPDDPKGLPALEAKLTPSLLADCAKLEFAKKVNLSMPKFKMEPPLIQLSDPLKALGLKTAFDDPHGSADFDGIAPRKPDDYLSISEVFHKTFLSLDEDGTEAAAATVVVMIGTMAMMPEDQPIEVHVDHPFLFAIQDRKSGACLFIGRVIDPR